MLAANATLSYAYTKDDIMSVSGVFYGLAAYAAIRLLMGRVAPTQRLDVATALTTVDPRDRNGVERAQPRDSSRRAHLRVQDAQRLGESARQLEALGPLAGRCAAASS